MYLFRFLNTPLGEGRQHRRLPRAANTLAPPLTVTPAAYTYYSEAEFRFKYYSGHVIGLRHPYTYN